MIGAAKSASIHEEELRKTPALMGAALRDKLLAGMGVSAVDYLAAQRLHRAFTEAIERFWDAHDVVFLTFAAAPGGGAGILQLHHGNHADTRKPRGIAGAGAMHGLF